MSPHFCLPSTTADWAFGTPPSGTGASAPTIILLSLLRGILLAAEHCRKKVFYVTSGIVLVMNAALLTSVSLMVLDQRPIQTGLTPAIALASYTTYKIGTAEKSAVLFILPLTTNFVSDILIIRLSVI